MRTPWWRLSALRLKSPLGFADFEELLDLWVRDVEIAGRRTAAQAALADRERQRVHDADEGNDAAGLAVEADGFADAADIAPIGADAAAAAGEPDILVPGIDDAVEAVGHRVEIAADRQPAPGAAVRQHGRRGHEPEPRDIVVEPLRVGSIIGVGRRDAHEEILIGFARQQIAVVERFLAEIGQQRIARMIDLDRIRRARPPAPPRASCSRSLLQVRRSPYSPRSRP